MSQQQSVLDRFFGEMQQLNVENPEEFFKLVKEMYSSDKNINLKTDIKNPAIHSALDLMGVYFKDVGMIDGSKYVKFYSLSLKEQMVSDNRKGRVEFKELMSAKLSQMMRSFTDRILGRHDKDE